MTEDVVDTETGELNEQEENLPTIFVTLNTNGRSPMTLDVYPLSQTCVNGVVTTRDVLGLIGSELGVTAQVFINTNPGTLDTIVHEGDVINISGKLAGGK
jgi:hypothetical protein